MSVIAVGDLLATRTLRFTRADLVRYAEAAGDPNPIHQDESVALAVGLPGVIAHGMLTMGAAVQPVVDWIAREAPGARIVEYGVRFTRPVVVDAEAGAAVEVSAKVGALDAALGTARIDLTVTFGGQTVLAKAQVALAGLPSELTTESA